MGEAFEPFDLGRYRCLKEIGSGGMAVVYKAELCTIAGFEKVYALKKIHRHLAEDQSLVEMFAKEAKMASCLDHGNIARVVELNEERGCYYIVMEYVDGVDLRELLDRLGRRGRTIPWDIAVFVAMEMAKALCYAHDLVDEEGEPAGIVHQDLSPANVMISRFGEVKLLDFGIAEPVGSNGGSRSSAMKGKYAYMSPEQLRSEPTDGRSDIFGLGALLYEMITGKRLFGGETVIQIIRRVERGGVPPLEGIEPHIQPVLLKMVASSRQRRFSDCGRLVRAFSSLLAAHGRSVTQKDLSELVSTSLNGTGKPGNPGVETVEGARREPTMERGVHGRRSKRLETDEDGPVARRKSRPRWTRRNRIILVFAVASMAAALLAVYLVLREAPSEQPRQLRKDEIVRAEAPKERETGEARGTGGPSATNASRLEAGGKRPSVDGGERVEATVALAARTGSRSRQVSDSRKSGAGLKSQSGSSGGDEGKTREDATGPTPEERQAGSGSRGRGLQPLTVRPARGKRADGDLDLHTEPNGASVIYKGKIVGKTPLRIKMSDGERLEVVLNKEGRRVKRKTLRMFGDSGRKLRVFLPNVRRRSSEASEGQTAVSVRCGSTDVYRVYLNGWDTGHNCPVTLRVEPGRNNVAIRRSGSDRLEYKDFRVHTGERATVEWSR